MKSLWIIWTGTILIWGASGRKLLPSILMAVSSILVLVDTIREMINKDHKNKEDE